MLQNCPDEKSLEAFAAGRIARAGFERVAAHLPGCSRCEQILARLEASPAGSSDDLIVNLRRASHSTWSRQVAGPDAAVRECAGRIVRALDKTPAAHDVKTDQGKHLSRLLRQGPCRLGQFDLLEELGCGSFGHVFRAHDRKLDRIVALKVQRAGSIASPDEQKRFLHEARSVARLKHPSIVALYETGQTEDGVCYLVTEYVQGETLESRLRHSRPGYRPAAQLVWRLARAMHYAHQEGIVHRDVKPSNILIDGNGDPHLADFGLAKRDSPDGTLTSDGHVMGTPAYMPPEHARGFSHESDGRSDIYSMGVILYEMLTGERPFQGTRRLLLLQVLDEEPRPLRQLDEHIPRDLETICLKAMAKQPVRRYQTAGEFAADLQNFLNGDPIVARPASYLEKLRRWSARYPFAVALLVAIVLSSIAGFLYLRSLNTWIVEEMALENTRLYSDMMEEFNEYYSEIRGSFFHPDDPAALDDPAGPPLPATMRIEVAERISCNAPNGMKARVFSPFAFRQELHPRDDFERQTLEVFNQQIRGRLTKAENGLEHYRFQVIGDKPYLKYARGQRMTASCIDCHNQHPETPKSDWNVGDLAGVFSLTRPLEVDVERAREGFRGATLLVVAISLTLTVCGLVLAVRSRKTIRQITNHD